MRFAPRFSLTHSLRGVRERRRFRALGDAESPVTPLRPYTIERYTTGARDPARSHLAIRLSITALIVAGLFSVLLVRLWTLQVIEGPKLYSQAQKTTTRVVATPAPRGLICARGGCPTSVVNCKSQSQVLAADTIDEVVTVSRSELVTDSVIVAHLAQLFGVSTAYIQNELEAEAEQYSPYAPLPVAGIPPNLPKVSSEDIAEIAQHPGQFPGVSFTQSTERCYPYDDLAAQTIGYVGAITAQEYKAYAKDGYQETDTQFGQSGLEAEYELALRGKAGNELVEVDPTGVPVKTLSEDPAVPGDDVVLNLDIGLEQTLQNALIAELNALHQGANQNDGVNADWAGAVVLDAQNGAVLAMDSYPTYNANDWVPVISKAAYNSLLREMGRPLNNYAVTGLQAPGSTFKLATATAALDDGLITPDSYIDDTGSYTIGTTTLHDADAGALGEINVTTALAKSSDVFFYTLGGLFAENTEKYGQMPIQDIAKAYGVGVSSGIDLTGALPGQVDSAQLRIDQHDEDPKAFPNDQWYPGDNVEMAFGQGETLTTPLEMANAYATFANGGTRYQPQMAAALLSPSGKVLERITPKVEGHVRLPSAAGYQAMLAGFEGAVQPGGTAGADFTGFNFSKWNIAGKTGTATANATSTTAPTAWFVAFGGPKNEKPQYVVAVEVDQAGYGADAAAPVARQVFDYLYNHVPAPVHL
jgi:penicillin-binding protein 2